MVTTNDDYIRLKCKEARNIFVYFLDSFDFTVKISQLSKCIRFFNMQVKEIKIVPIFLQGNKLIIQGLNTYIKHMHSNKPGHATVHPILSNGSSFKAIFRLKSWQIRELCKSAQ